MRGESRVAAHDPVSTDLARAPWGTSAFRGTKASGVACDAPTAGREEGPRRVPRSRSRLIADATLRQA